MPKPSGKESSHHSLAESFFDVVGLPEQLKQSANFIKDNNIVSETNVFKKTNRQNIILGLLKKKKELTIKDISHVIKDCSEKTIQRELLTLISAGVLKKIGERRWSKYSMV
jgi:predicted HTH transcriptional regulator